MSGWVAFDGQVDDFQSGVERFRKVFSVPNIPALKIKIIEIGKFIKILLWAWNEHSMPDINVQKNSKGDVLILCGVITDTGNLFCFNPDQEITSCNILEYWSR